MTTGGSGDDNESIPQEDTPFRQEMERIGARVPPGRMGNAKDLATVSQKPYLKRSLEKAMMKPFLTLEKPLLSLATNDYTWGTISIIDGGIAQSVAGHM